MPLHNTTQHSTAQPSWPPPCLRHGFVTFGSFNNFMKIDPAVIRVWAEILRAVPGSRLLLKHRDARDPAAQEHFSRIIVVQPEASVKTSRAAEVTKR